MSVYNTVTVPGFDLTIGVSMNNDRFREDPAAFEWAERTLKEIRERMAARERAAPAAKVDGKSSSIDVGHMDYSEYLETSLWRRIRRRVLKRDNKVCFYCRGIASLVHHRSYELAVLKGHDDSKLVSMCEGCHELIHVEEGGRRRSSEETDVVLLAWSPPTGWPEPTISDLNRPATNRPSNWHRMTSVQRAGWETQFSELYQRLAKERQACRKERLAVDRKKNEQRATRRAARLAKNPPPAGWIPLPEGTALACQQGAVGENALDWYRRDAKSRGFVSIGRDGRGRSVRAQMFRRQWHIDLAELHAAIADDHAYRQQLRENDEAYSAKNFTAPDGKRVQLSWGYYVLKRPFRFVYSTHAALRARSDGGWVCNGCDRRVEPSEADKLICTVCGYERTS